MIEIVLSGLVHTWFIDVDGTVLRHNGYLIGEDSLLPGIHDFWKNIPERDVIVLLSAREECLRDATLGVFKDHGLRFDHALFGLPVGERVLINDSKPFGLLTAIALCPPRDFGLVGVGIRIDPSM